MYALCSYRWDFAGGGGRKGAVNVGLCAQVGVVVGVDGGVVGVRPRRFSHQLVGTVLRLSWRKVTTKSHLYCFRNARAVQGCFTHPRESWMMQV